VTLQQARRLFSAPYEAQFMQASDHFNRGSAYGRQPFDSNPPIRISGLIIQRC
jgi:hypothetical protein